MKNEFYSSPIYSLQKKFAGKLSIFPRFLSGMLRILSVLVGFTNTLAYADIFKWQEQNGKTHYTDSPPRTVPSKDVSGQLAAPPCDAECKANAMNIKSYQTKYLQQSRQSEAKRRAELESIKKSSERNRK